MKPPLLLCVFLASCTSAAISPYFCPQDNCEDKVIEQIAAAENEILFATYSFTHPGIATAVMQKADEGVHVEGVVDQSYYSQLPRLQHHNIDIYRDNKTGLMHNKFWVIDGKVVITGSMNPTKGGSSRNRDNIIIVEDTAVAAAYREEFFRLKE